LPHQVEDNDEYLIFGEQNVKNAAYRLSDAGYGTFGQCFKAINHCGGREKNAIQLLLQNKS
jgi:hypothetical protein